MTGSAAALERYPVRREIDGDFVLAEIAAHRPLGGPAREAGPLAGIAEAALAVRLWEPGGPGGRLAGAPQRAVSDQKPSRHDVELLRRIETSFLARPPVAEHVAQLTALRARSWLVLADHWIGVTTQTGDARFLNGACKLLGAVWSLDPATRWPDQQLPHQLASTALLLDQASADLAARLSGRRITQTGLIDQAPLEPSARCERRPVTVVLAGAESRSPARFLHALREVGGHLDAICWYGAPPSSVPPSAYTEAWYPPEDGASRSVAHPIDVPETHVTHWSQVTAVLTEWKPDLLVLLGMPIVPGEVLAIPSIGTINAHNGALPGYRGMDAVAWALLNDDPIVCSVHEVTLGVDAGPVLADCVVPFAPASALRARVKNTQLELLTAVTAHATNTGRLPDGTEQNTANARQFYRLHPHLKRVLDLSPYGRGNA